jgi:hypothetical protein
VEAFKNDEASEIDSEDGAEGDLEPGLDFALSAHEITGWARRNRKRNEKQWRQEEKEEDEEDKLRMKKTKYIQGPPDNLPDRIVVLNKDKERARYALMSNKDDDTFREFEDPRRYMFLLDLQIMRREERTERERRVERRTKLHNLAVAKRLRNAAKDSHRNKALKQLEEELKRLEEKMERLKEEDV